MCDGIAFSLLMPLFKTANQKNIKIMLDGVPGDNVVIKSTGYISYLLKERNWVDWVAEVTTTQRILSPNQPLWEIIYRSVRKTIFPEWIKTLRGKKKNREDSGQKSIIEPAFADKSGLYERMSEGHGIIHPISPSTIRENHADNLNAGYITAALERADRIASLYSIEPRHPFLDTQLVEFCLALPWTASFYRGRTKVVQRDAMTGFLPEEILNSEYCQNPGRYFIKEMFRVKKDYFDYLVNY